MEVRLTESHIRQYQEQGYCLLSSCVPSEHLEMLRGEVQGAMARMDARMDAAGVDQIFINQRNKRYFINGPLQASSVIGNFIRSPLMVDCVRQLLGP
jgi:hypothetical protein